MVVVFFCFLDFCGKMSDDIFCIYIYIYYTYIYIYLYTTIATTPYSYSSYEVMNVVRLSAHHG